MYVLFVNDGVQEFYRGFEKLVFFNVEGYVSFLQIMQCSFKLFVVFFLVSFMNENVIYLVYYFINIFKDFRYCMLKDFWGRIYVKRKVIKIILVKWSYKGSQQF